ncbi:cytochrome P450 [Russula brevipes]|nr:cytochrome P450 [Russula brevipes]
MPVLTRYDILLGSLTILFSLALLFVAHAGKKRLPYPPGPKRLPIVGNLFNMPSRAEWFTYLKWSQEFDSDVIHADVMGSHIIILNSIKAAQELLEKRSSIYSDRPPMIVLRKLLGMDFNIGFMPYGPTWRYLRRAFHINFLPTKLEAFRPFEQRAVHRLLRNLLTSPDNFPQHLRHMTGQGILSVAYGVDVLPEGDPFVEDAENVLRAMAFGSTKQALMFDTIPWLIRIPSWLPGARGFKRNAHQWRLIVETALQTPYDKVKSELAVPGTMYIAGADTTVTALEIFILAMTLYLEVQRKAQEEIDRVVGNSRLPGHLDQDDLPYVQAVVKEVLRWHPVTPLSVPHRVTQSDEYEGYFIPAGSIIIPNVWGMLHDPNVFAEPRRFYPERWFSPNAPTFPNQAFGFGARLCPGRFFARRSIWANMVGILATFKITPTEDGPPQPVFSSGLISYVV